jgi:protoporphyrinogen oxidase
MLAVDLADRLRHGRILLRGKFIHFPLKMQDLLLRLDRRFAAGALRDVGLGLLRPPPGNAPSFAEVLQSRLGPTICRHFYFPYARKIWGRDPHELSGIQAQKRVTANTIGSLLRRVVRPPGKGRFYYPRNGFGQICRAYADEAAELGADLLLGWKATRIERAAAGPAPWEVHVARGGETRRLAADHVWSTLPVTVLARLVEPGPPPDVLRAAEAIDYRAMILVYLELDCDRFSATDAHYFPEEHIRATRISEPKNYFGAVAPAGRTVLCAEIPCSPDDAIWSQPDDALGRLVAADLAAAGIPLARPPVAVFTRRLRHAYPIYTRGYEAPLARLQQWVEALPNLLSYGRQGLFAHDNTHHALFMAYRAVDCLTDGVFDTAQWARHQEVFATHVVED